MTIENGGPAFPNVPEGAGEKWDLWDEGMSLRDYFAAQTLHNADIYKGDAPDWQLKQWFGDRGGITSAEIAAKQAYEMADAMIEARK